MPLSEGRATIVSSSIALLPQVTVHYPATILSLVPEDPAINEFSPLQLR